MARETGASEKLLEEASTLVEAAFVTPSVENVGALARWRGQSPEHEAAAKVAEDFHKNVFRLQHVDLSVLQKAGMATQLWSDRLGGPGVLSAFAVLLLIGIGSYVVTLPKVEEMPVATIEPVIDMPDVFKTGFKQQRRVELGDGSTLWLDWSTEVHVQMFADRRDLTLVKGRVAIAAQTDQSRPLIVESGSTTTRVTGTEFLVSHLDNETLVSVIEGSVEVIGADESIVGLAPAQSVSVSNGTVGPIIIRPLEELGTWREGMLVFRDRPLIDALDTLSSYTSFSIDTSKLWLDHQIVSGTFFIDRADDAAISIITANRLEFELKSPNTLVVKERRPTRPK